MGPIEEHSIIEQRYCSKCKFPCSLGDFKQMVELKSSGLLIYVHKDTKSAEQKKNKDVFILHNPSDKELKRPDYIKEMCQYKTKCIQCREFIRRVRSLLDEITGIKQNEVIGVCEYCKRLNGSGNCKRCEYFAKKFKCCQADQRQAKNERFLAWLRKVDELIQNILECKNVCTNRLYNEPSKHLNELLKLLQELKPPIDVDRLDLNLLTEIMKSVYDSKVTEMLEELLLKMRFESDILLKLPSEHTIFPELSHYRLMQTLAKNKDKLEEVLRKMKYDIDSKIFSKMQKYAGSADGRKGFEISGSVDSLAKNKEILEELLSKVKYDRMVEFSSNSMVSKDLFPKEWFSNLKLKIKKNLDEKESGRQNLNIPKTKHSKNRGQRRDSFDTDSLDSGDTKDQKNKILKRDHHRDSSADDARCHKNKMTKNKINRHDLDVDHAKYSRDAPNDIIGKIRNGDARNTDITDAREVKYQRSKINKRNTRNQRMTGADNEKDHIIKKKENNNQHDSDAHVTTTRKDALKDRKSKRSDYDSSNTDFLDTSDAKDQKLKKRFSLRLSSADNSKDHNIKKKVKNNWHWSDSDDAKNCKDVLNDKTSKRRDKNSSSDGDKKEKYSSKLTRLPFDETKDVDSFANIVKKRPSYVIRGNKLVPLKYIEKEELEAETPSYKPHIHKSRIYKPKIYKELELEDLDQTGLPAMYAPFGGLVTTTDDDGLENNTPIRERKSALRLRSFTETEEPRGVLYKLSDGEFIKKGWTIMPKTKTLRKVYIYKMEPALPQYDWFEKNKSKKVLYYDSGEKLADIDDDGHGRWYYKNGEVALDFHNTEKDIHGGQRYVVYSRGDEVGMGKTSPCSVLASFDYHGNGVVYDRYGTERLKYNQFEGVLHDERVGPTSRWKWHSLNEPPELHEVFIENYVEKVDPGFKEIFKNVSDKDNPRKPRRSILEPNNPNIQAIHAIEGEHVAKHLADKVAQKFKPFKIRPKTLKMNDSFSLRVIDQANIYVLFREGTIKLKLNVGMNLINELVDADTIGIDDVVTPYELLPPLSQSLDNIQKSVENAKKAAKIRAAKADHLLMPPKLSRSAYKVGIGLKEMGNCAVRPQTAYPAFQMGR